MTLEQVKVWIRNAYESHDRDDLERALAKLDELMRRASGQKPAETDRPAAR